MNKEKLYKEIIKTTKRIEKFTRKDLPFHVIAGGVKLMNKKMKGWKVGNSDIGWLLFHAETVNKAKLLFLKEIGHWDVNYTDIRALRCRIFDDRAITNELVQEHKIYGEETYSDVIYVNICRCDICLADHYKQTGEMHAKPNE